MCFLIMKKDRNTFFNEANFSQASYMGTPNMQPQMMPQNFGAPTYSGSQASQSFYSGPVPMMQNNGGMPTDNISDIESRMSKIERQMNRLDARISKLENKGLMTTENYDNTTNMYML